MSHARELCVWASTRIGGTTRTPKTSAIPTATIIVGRCRAHVRNKERPATIDRSDVFIAPIETLDYVWANSTSCVTPWRYCSPDRSCGTAGPRRPFVYTGRDHPHTAWLKPKRLSTEHLQSRPPLSGWDRPAVPSRKFGSVCGRHSALIWPRVTPLAACKRTGTNETMLTFVSPISFDNTRLEFCSVRLHRRPPATD